MYGTVKRDSIAGRRTDCPLSWSRLRRINNLPRSHPFGGWGPRQAPPFFEIVHVGNSAQSRNAIADTRPDGDLQRQRHEIRKVKVVHQSCRDRLGVTQSLIAIRGFGGGDVQRPFIPAPGNRHLDVQDPHHLIGVSDHLFPNRVLDLFSRPQRQQLHGRLMPCNAQLALAALPCLTDVQFICGDALCLTGCGPRRCRMARMKGGCAGTRSNPQLLRRRAQARTSAACSIPERGKTNS